MYDVVIIGGGIGGLSCAYSLIKNNSDLNILIVDKGKSLEKRKCPASNNNKCCKCKICSITTGIAGAGAFSDGKFNLGTNYGGTLGEEIGEDVANIYINQLNDILSEFGADVPVYNSDKELKDLCSEFNLKLLDMNVRHLGTDKNYFVMLNLVNYLKEHNVKFFTETKCEKINKINLTLYDIEKDKHYIISGKNIVIATGRTSGQLIVDTCARLNIPLSYNKVDIGVRVETNDIIMEEINKNLYEGKFIYRTSVGTIVRTFCSNPSGHVVVENHSGTMLANGHAYASKELGSNNTNFALLVAHKFSEPFDLPNEYAHQVSRLANELSCGSIIVQRYGDICKGRRSTQKRIDEGFVKPSLKEAVPGDLGLVLPYNTMKSIIEMIEALNHVTPGIANEHTLFYGVEAKFYSARPEISNNFETRINGLYVGGDGAGLTRGLAQAGANGVYVARDILKKTN